MIFLAKTKYSNRLKSLFELLFNNMGTACFTIDKKGMHLKNFTTQNIMLEVHLEAELFNEYEMNQDESIHIGLGSYVNQSFKTIKNKSIVELCISNPNVLDIKITSPTDNCVFTLSAMTESVQNVSIMPYYDYETSGVKISTPRFSAMCRQFKEEKNFTTTKEKGLIKFRCGVENIYSKYFQFGVEDVNDNDLIHHTYSSDQFLRIVKIVSFSSDNTKYLEVFVEKEKPMMILCSSEIGVLKAYILAKNPTN